jgi:hypothetical protein
MERVGILINKLQEQLKQQADAKSMLVTVQMLNTELMQSMRGKNGYASSKVSVFMPQNYSGQLVDVSKTSELSKIEIPPATQSEVVIKEEDDTIPKTPAEVVEELKPKEVVELDVLKIPEAPPIIKREHSSWIFDPIEAPTMAQQDKVVYELNDSMVGGEKTMNDKLKEDKPEVAHILHDVPIRDLKKAISINDRHRFIEDLFRGDETMYERSVKTINNFNNHAEAEFWMQRELKLKLAWDNNNGQVKLFDQLVRRRFS